MSSITRPMGVPVQAMHIPHMARMGASELPLSLGADALTQVLSSAYVTDCDMRAGNIGMWVIDRNAQFGPMPTARTGHIMQRNVFAITSYQFNVGRGPAAVHIALPYDAVSRHHMEISLLPDLVEIKNMSETNGIFVGGAWVAPQDFVRIKPDAPFIIGINDPRGSFDGSLLISPMKSAPWNHAIAKAREQSLQLAQYVRGLHFRDPWAKMRAAGGPLSIAARRRGVPCQAIKTSEVLITPPQISDKNYALPLFSRHVTESGHVRAFIRGWIDEGRLDKHVQGHKKWDERLLANMRQGGMLLPTHSTCLESAIKICRSGTIDPAFFKKDRAFFRYGLGHSYGEIVFVMRPGIEGLGRINDLWGLTDKSKRTREELFRLVNSVTYNRDIRVKQEEALNDGPMGRSVMYGAEQESSFMELFPQFESEEPVDIVQSVLKPITADHAYAILAPDHLYDELIEHIPEHMHDLVLKIPGTGTTEEEFLKGRELIARRTRYRGGTFEPKIGLDALLRYELTYFKIVESVVRYRHRELRKRVETFARDAAQGELVHMDILDRIASIAAVLPETFHLMRLQKQYPSHDGHSPSVHTLNALIEAAYLAPSLMREFPELKVEDAFIALLYHDVGKMHGAKRADHDELSIEMAKYHLKMMDLQGKKGSAAHARRTRILHLLENDGYISDLSKLGDAGVAWKAVADHDGPPISPDGDVLLPEIFLVNFADVASIPGRSGRQMKVNKDYDGVIDVRRKLIEVFRKLQDVDQQISNE